MLTLKIPRRLESPNTWNGRHWRVKHQISRNWENEIGWAAVEAKLGRRVARRGVGGELLMDWAVSRLGVEPGRVRVVVERHVPSGRNFIRDDDNLRFCVKPLLDASHVLPLFVD